MESLSLNVLTNACGPEALAVDYPFVHMGGGGGADWLIVRVESVEGKPMVLKEGMNMAGLYVQGGREGVTGHLDAGGARRGAPWSVPGW